MAVLFSYVNVKGNKLNSNKVNIPVSFSILAVLILSACNMSAFTAGPDSSDSTPSMTEIETRTIPTIETSSPTSPPPTNTPLPTNTPMPTETPKPPAAILPDPAGFQWQQVISGLHRPVDLAEPKDDSGNLYVVEQAGVIRIIQDGVLLPDPFLDIRDRVGSGGNEQGLLGIAFHPQFIKNGYFFVNYTDMQGNTVIARFSGVMEGNSYLKADPISESVLLRVDQPYANHNGGRLIFGPDGYLWIGLGDGGSQGDPNGNGQSNQTLLGKILRIDVDNGSPYVIPPDNPYVNGGGLPEIWAVGLRNPWRFSFDRLTGDLFIGDVGQNSREEIDHLPAGYVSTPVNFGWNRREGSHPYSDQATTDTTGLTEPIFDYGHDSGCSVAGGFVYRGKGLPDFHGVYLFGDYCSGLIWGLVPNDKNSWDTKILFSTGYNIASFAEDQNGEIYLLDLNGSIYRLEKK
jgi:glucose/arabinose dehydrogenase